MDNIYNPYQQILENQEKIINQNEKILKRLGKVNLNNEFNIPGREKASKILAISLGILDKKIKEGKILKKNIHYRFNGKRKYSFSEEALYSIKGLL